MKKMVLLAFGLLLCIGMDAQSMRMVVDSNGDIVGRLVRINASTYTVDVQDTYDVPKAGNRVVTFKAENGQGIVYRKGERSGNINVRKGPSIKTAVVGKITEPDGVPDTFPCLGKKNGWYKIRLENGTIGYVREDMVNWDGMSSF